MQSLNLQMAHPPGQILPLSGGRRPRWAGTVATDTASACRRRRGRVADAVADSVCLGRLRPTRHYWKEGLFQMLIKVVE
ncbi:hypothetical protein TNCT6_76040 [Streptomyces sp. 6-11-2]|nr:hypothetical protein TNCT6_76040 [Streptomyces sp. 6-11-2]